MQVATLEMRIFCALQFFPVTFLFMQLNLDRSTSTCRDSSYQLLSTFLCLISLLSNSLCLEVYCRELPLRSPIVFDMGPSSFFYSTNIDLAELQVSTLEKRIETATLISWWNLKPFHFSEAELPLLSKLSRNSEVLTWSASLCRLKYCSAKSCFNMHMLLIEIKIKIITQIVSFGFGISCAHSVQGQVYERNFSSFQEEEFQFISSWKPRELKRFVTSFIMHSGHWTLPNERECSLCIVSRETYSECQHFCASWEYTR